MDGWRKRQSHLIGQENLYKYGNNGNNGGRGENGEDGEKGNKLIIVFITIFFMFSKKQ